jgi:signal peptidase II
VGTGWPSGLAQAIISAVLMIGVLVLYLRRFAPAWRWVAVAAAVCLVDQGVKRLVSPATAEHRIVLFGGWLRISYLRNPEQGFGGSFSYLALTTLVCVALLLLLYRRLAKSGYRMSLLAELGCALMIGGYLAIMFDRVRLGFVVDFLEFGRGSPFVYNLADLAILLAAALLIARAVQFLAEAKAKRLGLRDRVIP